MFVFWLYIFSVFRLGDGDRWFVLQFVSDIVTIDGDDTVDNLLPSCPHMVCFPFLIAAEDIISKYTV